MPKLNFVHINDPCPSSMWITIECRELLWGMVEVVKSRMENEIHVENLQYSEICTFGLPTEFGKKHKKRKRNSGIFLFDSIPKLVYNSVQIEHNVYEWKDDKVAVLSSWKSGDSQVSEVKLLDGSRRKLIVDRKNLELVVGCDKLIFDTVEAELTRSFSYGCPSNVDVKYWDQRYRLFSKFDHGIMLDDESWYSITPEPIAKFISKKVLQLSSDNAVVLDLFCGCGGNSVSLASFGHFVFSVDIDLRKLQMLRHNAGVYNCANRVEMICSDAVALMQGMIPAAKLSSIHERYRSNFGTQPLETRTPAATTAADAKGALLPLLPDVIVMSPPWGGPEYLQAEQYDLESMLPCGSGFLLAMYARAIARNLVYILPRNITLAQIAELQKLLGCEWGIESIYLHKALKLKLVLFGPIAKVKQKNNQ